MIVPGATSMIPNNNNQEKTLARTLKEETRYLHTRLEETTFSNKLGKNKVTDKEYVAYLSALLKIYEQLESEINLHDSLSTLQIPSLYRTEKIKADLKSFGSDGKKVVKAALDYQDHLKVISEESPHKLIAHAYIRYLGDLFGGQQFSIEFVPRWPEGSSFYQFPELLKEYDLKAPARFVAKFRKILNEMKLTPKEEKEVIEEAEWAFEQHISIFEQLEGSESTLQFQLWL